MYQIVYHTNVKGIAWVVVDGKEYYDECGAIIKSESIHHNVSIPTDVLDKAGEYTICFAPVGERKPYFPEKGDQHHKADGFYRLIAFFRHNKLLNLSQKFYCMIKGGRCSENAHHNPPYIVPHYAVFYKETTLFSILIFT